METVKRRLENEQPMTFLEFNYPLLQSYDFVELYKRHGCRLQLGGSDQWGNITTGVDLTRRMEGGECYGYTRSPYEYWQFWRNTEDADVVKFIRLFTEMSEEDVVALEALEGADINRAKIAILTAATKVSLASSNGEARRHIKQGALKLNDAKVASHELTLSVDDIIDGVVKISIGKKKHALLKVTDA